MWVMKFFEDLDLTKEIIFKLFVDQLGKVDRLDRNGATFFLMLSIISS